MSDELSAPLGRKPRKRPAPRSGARGLPLARMGLGLLALLGAGAIGWIIAVDDPMGGLPQVQAPVGAPEPNALADRISSTQPMAESPPAAPAISPASGPSIITLGEDFIASGSGEAPLSQADRDIIAFGAQPGLVEITQSGMIPRVSPTGERPFEAYGRPSLTPATAGGRGLVTIVVTGLGLNPATTADAIDALPGTVTLAFAPYGTNLVPTAIRAREDGHEILLEVPLEPFDYPQSDPGPHTLLVEQPPRDNLEKLYWVMAQLGGYTGIINHMGARFTASAADFGPIFEELSLRGIGYLDDGSSARSIAEQLARDNGVPYLRADRSLDSNPSRAAILSELERLETLAAQRGHAVGTVSALPVSIATLAEWSRGLDSARTIIVPFSALALRGAPETIVP